MKKIILLCGLLISVTVARADNNAFEAASRQVATTLKSQNLIEAQSAAQEMLTLAQNPQEKSRALLNLGVIAKKQNNDKEARQFWMQVVQLQDVTPEYKGDAYYLIGGSYLDEKNYPAARENLQLYLQMEGSSADERATARLAIAATYENEKSFPESRATLGEIISDKSVSPPLRAAAQETIGETFFSQQNWPEAIAAFHAVADVQGVSPTLIATAQSRANDAYVSQGHTEFIGPETEKLRTAFLQKAEEIAQSDDKDLSLLRENLTAALILTDPDSIIGLYTREKIAETYLISKDYGKAREELEKLAIYPTPTDATPKARHSYELLNQKAQQNLAASYRLEGQTQRARQEYQKVLQMPNLDPNIQKLVF